eukprot:PhF_6_TR939/c0_g1_i3/m.1687
MIPLQDLITKRREPSGFDKLKTTTTGDKGKHQGTSNNTKSPPVAKVPHPPPPSTAPTTTNRMHSGGHHTMDLGPQSPLLSPATTTTYLRTHNKRTHQPTTTRSAMSYRILQNISDEAYEGQTEFRTLMSQLEIDELTSAVESQKAERLAMQGSILSLHSMAKDLASMMNTDNVSELPTSSINQGLEKKCRELHGILQSTFKELDDKKLLIEHLQRELENRDNTISDLKEKLLDMTVQAKALETKVVHMSLEQAERNQNDLAGFSMMSSTTDNDLMSQLKTSMRMSKVAISAPDPMGASMAITPTSKTLTLPNKIVEGPKGRVCVVFTEVQGSLGLWEKFPGEMKDSVAILSRILRSEAERANGYEVKVQGDKYMGVFPTATDALKFSLGAQVSLVQATWHEVFNDYPDTTKVMEGMNFVWRGLRVRMGIHLGDVLTEIDPMTGRTDYFGPTVNVAQRACHIAQGGFVYISEDVKNACDVEALPVSLAPSFAVVGLRKLRGAESGVMILSTLPKSLMSRRQDTIVVEEEDAMDAKESELKATIPIDKVCLVAIRVQGAQGIEARDTSLWKKAKAIYSFEVKVQAEYAGGYVSIEEEDKFLIAFPSADAGVGFSLKIQHFLLYADWPVALLQIPMCKVHEAFDKTLFRGLRVTIGIHYCDITVELDPRTDTFRYHGAEVSVPVHLSSNARAGETLLSDAAFKAMNKTNFAMQDPFIKFQRESMFPDIGKSIKTYIMFPRELQLRLAVLDGKDPKTALGETEAAGGGTLVLKAPTGNVTVMCGDIDNSVDIQNSLNNPDLWNQAKTLFHDIVLRSVERFNGVVFRKEGISFLAAFHDVSNAVYCGMYIQERLLVAPYTWQMIAAHETLKEFRASDGTLLWNGFRARIGIHNGIAKCEMNPETQNVGYYGAVVNRAVAIASTGVGGQVLLSWESYDTVVDVWRLPSNARTKPHVVELQDVKLAIVGPQELPVKLCLVVPMRLKARMFPTIPLPDRTNTDPLTQILALNNNAEKRQNAASAQSSKSSKPPSGNVTFVLADVQGVAMLESVQEMMIQESMRMLAQCLRGSLAQHHGYEFRSGDDSFMFAFDSAQDAVSFCVAAQMNLLSMSWSPELNRFEDCKTEADDTGAVLFCGLRVRLVATSGSPTMELEPVSGKMDYFGQPIHKLFRIASCAHGGEILISAETHNQIDSSNSNTKGYVVRSTGVKAIPGESTPVTLYQVLPTSLVYRRFKDPKDTDFPQDETRLREEIQVYDRLCARNSTFAEPPKGKVAIVFVEIHGIDMLTELSPTGIQQALAGYGEALRETLKLCRGHICKAGDEGTCMVAFHTALDAIRWAMYFQKEVLTLSYPQEMLKSTEARISMSADGELTWRGFRVKLGIHYGDCELMEPASSPAFKGEGSMMIDMTMPPPVSPTMTNIGTTGSSGTDTLEYKGQAVSKAWKLCLHACGGEILVSAETLQMVPNLQALGYPIVTPMGESKLSGGGTAKIYRITAMNLQGRIPYFTETRKVAEESKAKGTDDVDPPRPWWRSGRRGSTTNGTVSDDEEIDGPGDSEEFKKREAVLLKKIKDLKIANLVYKEHAEDSRAEIANATADLAKLHKFLRSYFALLKVYLDPYFDEKKPPLSTDEFVSKWVAFMRAVDDPKSKAKAKRSAKDEVTEYLRVILDTDADEKTHCANSSKLSKSLVGHAARHFVYLSKALKRSTFKVFKMDAEGNRRDSVGSMLDQSIMAAVTKKVQGKVKAHTK